FTPSARTDGSHTFTATATDAAGNVSDTSGSFVITIDTHTEMTITGLQDDAGTVTGLVADGGLTDDSNPVLIGTAEPGSIVYISSTGVYGEHYSFTATVGDDGKWTLPQGYAKGNYGTFSYSAYSVDTAGNHSEAVTFSVDFVAPNQDDITPPDAPVITGAIETYDDGTNIGVANDATIDDNTPRLYGDAEAGSIVTVYDGAVVIGSVAADSKGAWTYDVSRALADGKHTFTITATDAAGNTSIHSGNFVLDVETADTTPPDAPVITEVYDDQGLTQGPVANGGKTDDSLLKISGTAEHDSIVVISHVIESTGTTYIDGSVVADASGHWVFDMTGPFQPTFGNRIITATATDAAGNTSVASDSYVVNFVDTNYDGTTPPGVSGIESFNQADMPDIITNSFTTESGLVVKSLGGKIDLEEWPNSGADGHDLRDETGGYNYLDTVKSAGVNITLPGSADSVTFVGAIDVSDSSSVQAYDWAGHLITVSVTDIGRNSNGGLFKYLITPAEDQHIASFTVVGSPFIDTIQWTSADTAHAAQQSALLTSPDAVDYHDIMTLAQVDDSNKSTAAVDITDHVQNTLHLTLNDILSEAHPNLFVQDGKQQLAVTGDQGDVVELKVDDLAHNTWQDSGAVTAGGVQYEVYQHAGSDVELLVQHGLELHQVS
ncbi:Ig-like domain-containing protein, partial [Rahnella woolbedingensis]